MLIANAVLVSLVFRENVAFICNGNAACGGQAELWFLCSLLLHMIHISSARLLKALTDVKKPLSSKVVSPEIHWILCRDAGTF